MMSLTGILYVIMPILMSQTVFARSFVYLSENGGNPCMLLDIEFTIVITAYNGVFEASASRTEIDVQSVLGSCSHDTLALTFDDETHWILWFHQQSDGSEQLDSSLQFVPSSLFQNNVSSSDILLLKDEIPVELFNTLHSYECDNLGLFKYTKIATISGKPNYSAQVTVSSFGFQTFDLKSGTSSPSVWCLQDNTTATTSFTNATTSSTNNSTSSSSTNTSLSTVTASQSTETSTLNITTSIPTIPSKPALNNYTVEGNNVTCILLQGAFTIDINYKTNSSQESTNTVSVGIPADATGTGNCNQTFDSQSLVISFFDDWSLEFVFTLEEPTLLTATSDASYGITNITLVYLVNPQLFPESAIPPNTKVTVFPRDSSDADFPRKASNKAFYQCDSNLEVKLQAGVTLQTSELQFTAFNTNDNITFAGKAENCLADEPTSHTIPIVVGCSLAGLGVVVTTVYAICKCRNKQKRSYSGI